MESSKSIGTFDVMVDVEKKGVAYDENPVKIETDDHCKEVLEKLMKELLLTDYNNELLKSCLAVVTAKEGDEFTFGPAELVELGQFACKYPEHAHEILACMDHISASLDFEGDVSPDFFAVAAAAHAILGDAVSAVAVANLDDSPKPAVESTPESQSFTEEVKTFAKSMATTYELMKSQRYIPPELTFEMFLADMLDEDEDGSDFEEDDEEPHPDVKAEDTHEVDPSLTDALAS